MKNEKPYAVTGRAGTTRSRFAAHFLRPYILAASVLFAFLCAPSGLRAQYYDWGNSPASIKWNRIRTSGVDIIYPQNFEHNARRTLWYFDTIRPYVSYGYSHGTMRTPVILHTQNMSGNGMVMWAPKRIELLSAPGSSYSEPWLKQLAIHEYRHNVQYNNLDRSTMRVLGWLFGQQIKFVGPAFFGVLFIEGDAVMVETEMSAFGRGLQPSFTIHYRAMGDVGSDKYSNDYWFCGSYRNHVPDHYRLGYQIVRWSYNHFDEFIFDTLARYISRNPQFFAPMSIGLKKFYGTKKHEIFQNTFSELNAHWDSLPKVEDSSSKIPTPFTSYVTYQWPLWLDDRTILAVKTDLDRPSRIVAADSETGAETVLANTGIPSSGLTLADGKLWWTEYRASTLWGQRVNSRLCFLDLETRRKGSVNTGEQIFYPVAGAGEGLAYVVYDYSGHFSIVKGLNGRKSEVVFPFGTEITGLAWDDISGKLYFIGLDDGGMWLGEADTENGAYRRLTPSRHITISDLRAQGGKLYFGSIASGKDEAHCYDLLTNVEYRLSESAYGSFQPSPNAAGTRAALTTYDRDGYKLAVQSTANAVKQEQRTLPLNLVNPDWKRWDLPKMDSLVYTGPHESASEKKYKSRRFRKGLNLFHPHSWLPLDFYPMEAIDEGAININMGATVMSQSLLSDAITWLGYGWSQYGGSSLRGGFSYKGLGPVLDVNFVWGGGSQTAYTPIPQSIEPKRYFSVTTALSLPLVLGSGYNLRVLTPAAEYMYTNGLIFRPYKNQPYGILTRGVERLRFSLTYSQQTRMAQKDLLPRWGFATRVSYLMNPTNSDFQSLYSIFVRGFLPGIMPNHSTTLRASWQQAVDNSGDSPFMFRMKEVFPRGALYDFSASRWASGSIDYQFPVWYPESGIPGFLYFKRIRLNPYFDYARWQSFTEQWSPLYAYGTDVIFDITPFRMPASATVALTLTVGGTSDSKKPYIAFGFSVPL